MALEAAPSASEATVSALMATAVTKDDDEPMVTILPQEVIDGLAELDLELSEGKNFQIVSFFRNIHQISVSLYI